MKTEPLEEAEAPPAFGFGRDGETGDSNRSISELIFYLRMAFRSSDFDRVEEILIAREEKLKRELERKEEQYELSRESLGIERLERAEAEEELKSFKAKCVELENLSENIDAMRERVTLADKRVKSAEERAKRSEERYERLLREVKKAEHERSCDLVELKKKNGELESEKRRAEEEVELWKRRFQELEEWASNAEGVKIALAENGARPTILITDSDDDCAPGGNSTEKEPCPRILKRKRSSFVNVNEDEKDDDNDTQDSSARQGQNLDVGIGGSSGNRGPAILLSNQHTSAHHDQAVLSSFEANVVPEVRDFTSYYAKCHGDEFDEFKERVSKTEEEVEQWRKRFWELEERVSKVEAVEIIRAENGALPAMTQCRTSPPSSPHETQWRRPLMGPIVLESGDNSEQISLTPPQSVNDHNLLPTTPPLSTTTAPTTTETPQSIALAPLDADANPGTLVEGKTRASQANTNVSCNAPHPILKLRPDRMNFKCKITTKCPLAESIEILNNALEDHPYGLQWFRESQFGHLFDVPKYVEISLTAMWMMLCREVRTKKNDEMWFVVNGIPIRYSLREHALMSGLRCSTYPEGWKKIGSEAFREKYFPGMNKVSVKDIKEALTMMDTQSEENQSTKRRGAPNREKKNSMHLDKLKMAVLFFLSSVLMHPDKEDRPIGEELLKIVDNLNACRDFPWGRHSYFYLMRHVEKVDLLGKSSNVYDKGAYYATWACPGFILPLMLLPFECIPVLSPEFAELRLDITGPVPRICRWMSKFNKKQTPSLSQILRVLGDTKDIRSILTPTPEEQQAAHMQGFVPTDDNPDATVDQWMTIIDSGANIYWEDVWRADVEGRRSFLHMGGEDKPARQRDCDERRAVTHEESGLPHVSPCVHESRRTPAEGFGGYTIMLPELRAHVDQRIVELMKEMISSFDRLEGKLDIVMDIVSQLRGS